MKRVYTVSAGHSNTEPGNTWGGLREADLMLELRHMVASKLREGGHLVREDGARGVNAMLAHAIALIPGAHIAIELHTNASSNTSATGVEVVALARHKATSQRIAAAIAQVLAVPLRRDGGWYDHNQVIKDRGFTPGFSRTGGLIVEVFFQSNPADLARYLDRKWLVASAIARALTEPTP
jgi:N-acetylmuramoyl-L-alanine amidase